MHRGFLKIASFLAALSVALGAFGAHALKKLVDQNSLATFETGVRYQFFHVIAIFLVAIIYKEIPSRRLKIAGSLFVAGIILFSGSLYILSLAQVDANPGYRWIGAITPFGGVCFIAGWLFMLAAFLQKDQRV
jgi:uncharacterized membrane protein YgdD (TMEM256/DUF423 family)